MGVRGIYNSEAKFDITEFTYQNFTKLRGKPKKDTHCKANRHYFYILRRDLPVLSECSSQPRERETPNAATVHTTQTNLLIYT